jgi:hypothetical protein
MSVQRGKFQLIYTAYLGVRATQHIKVGDIIADYHAEKITKEESDEILDAKSDSDRRSDYLMLLPFNGGIHYAAHEEFCKCHPGQRTIGRLFNCAKKTGPTAAHCNMKLRFYNFHEIEGEPKGCLFVSNRDISPLEEL